MRLSILAAILILPLSASAHSSTDSQTLQALLSEMRQLRLSNLPFSSPTRAAGVYKFASTD